MLFLPNLNAIPGDYWDELGLVLPINQLVEIKRWPGENGVRTDIDLATPVGRKTVIASLIRIREFILRQISRKTDQIIETAGRIRGR